MARRIVVLAVVGLTALAVRVLYARAVVFPGLDDPAFYLLVARNIAAGRGLVIDALWSYQVPFAAVTHPSNEYWMPLASLVMAPFLALAGPPSLWAAQIPGVLLGSGLALLTCAMGWRTGLTLSNGAVLVAGLLVGLSGMLAYQSVGTGSEPVFGFVAAAALLVAGYEPVPPPLRRAAFAGVLAGLAYLARNDGLLVPVAISLTWWWCGRRRAVTPVLLMAGAFLAIAIPWWVRNQIAFGTPLPASLLSSMWLTDYAQTFSYSPPPGPGDLLALGPAAIAGLRLEGLVTNLSKYLIMTFAWGLVAPVGLWVLRRRPPYALVGLYLALLFAITVTVFPVQTKWGLFYHSIAATMPGLALAAVWTVERGLERVRRPQYGLLAAAVFVGFAAYGVRASLLEVDQGHRKLEAQFAEVSTWLREHVAPDSTIMATQPHSLLYAAGYSAIPLPAADPPDIVLAAARRYQVRYLVMTERFGRYPQALEPLPAGFAVAYRGAGFIVYELTPGPNP